MVWITELRTEILVVLYGLATRIKPFQLRWVFVLADPWIKNSRVSCSHAVLFYFSIMMVVMLMVNAYMRSLRIHCKDIATIFRFSTTISFIWVARKSLQSLLLIIQVKWMRCCCIDSYWGLSFSFLGSVYLMRWNLEHYSVGIDLLISALLE